MKKIEEMMFIATVDFSGDVFLEDKQAFIKALHQGGYILHQDEETGDYEIYKEDS